MPLISTLCYLSIAWIPTYLIICKLIDLFMGPPKPWPSLKERKPVRSTFDVLRVMLSSDTWTLKYGPEGTPEGLTIILFILFIPIYLYEGVRDTSIMLFPFLFNSLSVFPAFRYMCISYVVFFVFYNFIRYCWSRRASIYVALAPTWVTYLYIHYNITLKNILGYSNLFLKVLLLFLSLFPMFELDYTHMFIFAVCNGFFLAGFREALADLLKAYGVVGRGSCLTRKDRRFLRIYRLLNPFMSSGRGLDDAEAKYLVRVGKLVFILGLAVPIYMAIAVSVMDALGF